MLVIYGLETEHRVNPVGIDAGKPRFSWKLKSDKRNVIQESYQILAYDGADKKELLWDSQVVKSEQSLQVLWDGPELTSCQRVYWKVIVQAGGETAESEFSFFEMGLLKPEDWKARWIEPEKTVDVERKMPAPYLRKIFEVKPGLKRARIYQSAHGLYECWMNGKLGTEEKFKPGLTVYYDRIQYHVSDVTELLAEGKNCWSVILADGWWRGMTGGVFRNNFGYKLAYIGQLVLEYEDGSTTYVITDDSFKTATGGLLESDMKDGDIFDAGKEPENWKQTDFDDSAWSYVHYETDERNRLDVLVPSRGVPVLEAETLEPKIYKAPNGERILDFGQNIAGYVWMKLRDMNQGDVVTLVHGETLDAEGNFTQKNILVYEDDPEIQKVEYICKGGAEEEYCPMFSVFGFQYVLLRGYEKEILPGDFTAVAVYSAMEETGTFSCSNPLLNQLVKNSIWSQKGNFLDVPTDCPTRERSAWTGDAQVYVNTASKFMNSYAFYEKWMQDISLEQYENGKVGCTVPLTNSIHSQEEFDRLSKIYAESSDAKLFTHKLLLGDSLKGTELEGSAGWGDAAVIIPYMLYRNYGDIRILENQYDSAKKWVDYMIREAKNSNPVYAELDYYKNPQDAQYVWDTRFHYGEWLEPIEGTSDLMELLKYPDYMTATMYLFYSSGLLAETAEILGKTADAEYYREFSAQVKRVYNKYFIEDDGTIQEGRQAPHVRALEFNLADEKHRPFVEKKLAALVEENGYKLNTGFLSTCYLLPVLTEIGYPEYAYKVLEQTGFPGWLYNVKVGATTILEHWGGFAKKSGSFNHYSYGAVCSFLFEYVAGIRPQMETPGYKHFLLKPVTGGTLTEASAEYESCYGRITSAWKKEKDRIYYRFEVPVNTTATIILPATEENYRRAAEEYSQVRYVDGELQIQVGSGTWTVTV